MPTEEFDPGPFLDDVYSGYTWANGTEAVTWADVVKNRGTGGCYFLKSRFGGILLKVQSYCRWAIGYLISQDS